MSLPLHVVLGAALDAARSALRDLDADQIPNDLRKVAGYGGALPPPLAASLLKGLEQYEWLREKAAKQLRDRSGGDRAEAAALYLDRPEGWELRLAEIAWSVGEAASGEIRRSAAAREQDLKTALKAVREKAKAGKREARAAVGALERRVAELAAERRAEAAGEARDQREAMLAVEAAERSAVRCREERDGAVEEARLARQALQKERTLRKRAETAAAGGAEVGGWVEDPGGLAARLDQTALMARPAARAGDRAAAGPAERVRLPKGVAPDRRTAIEWLLGLETAVTVIVDGYNLGYQMQGERAPGPARTRVAPLLQHLQKMARGALKVIVIYDSSLGPAETPVAPGLVTVRYSEAGETADDEIVRLAGNRDGPVVVVSDDRAVRDRCEESGAVPLWARALVEWAGTR